MPDYEWTCVACKETNPPYSEACRNCYALAEPTVSCVKNSSAAQSVVAVKPLEPPLIVPTSSAPPIRIVATAVLFGAAVPFVMSVLFFLFGALVAFQHGGRAGTLEALSSTFTGWLTQFGGFYDGTLTATLGGAAFSTVFHRLAITGCSITMRDLKFYAGGGCVAVSYVIFPHHHYLMPGLEIPFWIIINGFTGGLVGVMVPKFLLPEIPLHQRDANV